MVVLIWEIIVIFDVNVGINFNIKGLMVIYIVK